MPPNRHNSHPAHMLHTGNDDDDVDYAFVIKPSKFAHSDGKLDTCLSVSSPQAKNSSWSAFIEYGTSPSALSSETRTVVDGLATMTLKPRNMSTNDVPYEHERWYFGCINRDEAEKLLKLDGIERGDFLIRNSERKVDRHVRKMESAVVVFLFLSLRSVTSR